MMTPNSISALTVLGHVPSEPARKREIRKLATGSRRMSFFTVDRALCLLKKAGLIESPKHGFYRLKPKAVPNAPTP